MAALGGQESSSGYRPSWASMSGTNDFGPTDEVLDGSYTDENGNYYEHFNKGLDFGMAEGTPIDAVVGGTVISAKDSDDGWGVSVKIKDANGYTHNYGHLQGVKVAQGQQVNAGDIIGESGNTGRSSGPHLSYDVWRPDGYFVDPTSYVEGGGYDTVNKDSGATGRYQIMPDSWKAWSAEAGLPPGTPQTPENEEYVAAFKLQQFYDKTGSWADVAAMWYGPGLPLSAYTEEELNRPQFFNGQQYPSIQEYVDQVMGRAAKIGTGVEYGYQAPDGTWITGSPSSGSSANKYDPVKAKQDKEDRDYELAQRSLGFEVSRATEMDRRYDDVSGRMKDYGTVAKDQNDLLADIAAALGNEAALAKINQGIQETSIENAAKVNAGVNAGNLGYRDALAGSIWSNSLSPMQKELERIRAQMVTAPEGFADSILSTVVFARSRFRALSSFSFW